MKTAGMISMQRSVTFVLVLALLFSPVPSKAAEEKARLGRVVWSAFQCAAFAEMSGKKREHERLFEVAVKTGREFLEALKSGQISREAVNSEVPIGITIYLAGPSTDFILGRIFEAATGEAFDEIVKQDDDQTPLQTWIQDEDLRTMKAITKYIRNNCVLIR
jgi:hypothetical protein